MSDEEVASSVGIPMNWNDHEGWDTYYEAWYRSRGTPVLSFRDSLRFSGKLFQIQRFQVLGWKKLWFPGCGVSLLPAVYAAFGFDVWASDVSRSAIEFQGSLPPPAQFVSRMLSEQGGIEEDVIQQANQAGELHFQNHDFRSDFPERDFDCILNDRAFQGLPLDSMRRAATVHWRALKPGGHAFFYTNNLQGGDRTLVEDALLQAGFYVPHHDTERWYRETLDSTGIETVFAGGVQARFTFTDGEAMEGKMERHRQNQAILDRICQEYEKRIKQEKEKVDITLKDGMTKVACMYHSTG